jgi:hypothetical protein
MTDNIPTPRDEDIPTPVDESITPREEDKETEDNVFTFPSDRLSEVDTQFAKLNKKAAKLGCNPSSYIVRKKWIKHIPEGHNEITGEHIYEENIEMVTIEVKGETPTYNDWAFIATVEPTEGGNLIRKVPNVDVEVPLELRKVDTTRCDHCHAARKRNETFIVQHSVNKEFKVVGRQCIKDFLGFNASPQSLVKYIQDLFDICQIIGGYEDEDMFGGGGGRHERFVKMDEYLYRCAVVVAKLGYVSGAKARDTNEMSTANRVWQTFFLHDNYRGIYAKDIVKEPYYGYFLNLDGTEPVYFGKNEKSYKMTVDDYRNACTYVNRMMMYTKEEIIDKPEDELNDFLHNLQIILQHQYINVGQKGFAAAIFPVYFRHLKEGEEKVNYERAGYVGTVGERGLMTLKLTRVNTYEGNYGLTYIYSFTNGPDYLTWFSSKEQTMVVDHWYKVTGMVKSHDVSPKGYRQTIITRCKVGIDVTDECNAIIGGVSKLW